MRTQVGIVGAGPAGLLLSHLLHATASIVVLESRSRDYIEARVRAGVLEQGTVDLMGELGAGDRLQREGMPIAARHALQRRRIRIDLPVLTPGKIVTVYGQQEVVKDLIAARLAAGGRSCSRRRHRIDGLDGERPTIHFSTRAGHASSNATIVAGCDGFHGICRAAIPEDVLTVYERLSVRLARHPGGSGAAIDEMIYASHERRLRAGASARREHVAPLPAMRAGREPARVAGPPHLGRAARAPRTSDGFGCTRARSCRGRHRRCAASSPSRCSTAGCSRRRCRAHRAADRRQGPQPGRRRCARAVAGADRVLSHRRDRGGSIATLTPACTGCGRPRASPGG